LAITAGEDIDVETEDGFILRLHHLTSKKHEKRGHPVILQHGILSTSVTFSTSHAELYTLASVRDS
jgi:fluoride ion exporter CrcB/FEX